MPRLCNLAAKEQRFKRGKAMLRIPGSDLQADLDDRKALLIFVQILYTDLRKLRILRVSWQIIHCE